MILELDVGNTRVKWRLRRGANSLEQGWQERARDFYIEALGDRELHLKSIYVSSVADAVFEGILRQSLAEQFSIEPWFARSSFHCAGVNNSYDNPALMGVDRWLAMIAAYNHSGGAVCVVDAGSALTVDFVSEQGHHRGGYILPGIALMQSALLKNTDRVRFDSEGLGQLTPGRSTADAVNNGILLSQVGALSLALEQAKQHGDDNYCLYICGGDGERLLAAMTGEGTLRPELVLDGLAFAAAET